MPPLKQINCSVKLGLGNATLPEYDVRYHDGSVNCSIATPDTDMPFSIHVVANGYIAPGLACIVFIDGQPQCSRNAPCASEDAANGTSKDFSTVKTEFRLRQKEEMLSDGTYIGRDWTFARLRQATGRHDGSKRFDERVGTIEVLILRCHYDKYNLLSVPRQYKKKEKQQDNKTSEANPLLGPTFSTYRPARQQKAESKTSKQSNAGSDITVASGGLLFGNDGTSEIDIGTFDQAHTPSTDSALALDEISMSNDELDSCRCESDEDVGRTPYLYQYDGPSESSREEYVRIDLIGDSASQSSSAGFSVQPYWTSSGSVAAGSDHPRQNHHSRPARPTLVYPAPPPPTISKGCKPRTDRGVQVGKGALYAHREWQPEYIDSTSAPYAVFTFRYYSQRLLESRLKSKDSVRNDMHRLIQRAEQDQLHAMSRGDLIQQLLRVKDQQRRRGHDSEIEADSEADSEASQQGDDRWQVDDNKKSATQADESMPEWSAETPNHFEEKKADRLGADTARNKTQW